IMEQVRDGKSREEPEILKGRDFSRALFGALKDKMRAGGDGGTALREDPAQYGTGDEANPENLETLMAEAACEMENIIRRHTVIRWRENPDAQNRMRDDLDDFFVELQRKKGISMTWEQIDSVVDASISIAINRRDEI